MRMQAWPPPVGAGHAGGAGAGAAGGVCRRDI